MKKKNKYNVAVVGVGAVGVEMLRVLKEHAFPLDQLRVFARSRRNITVDGQAYEVQETSPEGFAGIDFALFAGTEGEKGAAVVFAPEAVKRGAVVIDNGADFRMHKNVPLVVPEVNGADARQHHGIIANPNCSTIQMVVALAPIHRTVGIKRVVVATYQAVSGAGRSALRQLWDEMGELRENAELESVFLNPLQCRRHADTRAFAQQIALNALAQIGGFGDDGFTSEEWKMVHETHKILHDRRIKVSATCIRVPVLNAHSEAVYLETRRPATVAQIRSWLAKAAGVIVIDDPATGRYPMPAAASGKDDVFVGRIRRDPFVKNGFWLWVVSDNLRKGAATNAVQIAEYLIGKKV